MAGFKCPHCSEVMVDNNDNHRDFYMEFRKAGTPYEFSYNIPNDGLTFDFFRCPSCDNYAVFCNGTSGRMENVDLHIYPSSFAIQFPEYVPEAVRSDYEEACSIIKLSPKASATLARRCLQGMIRDFWGIKEKTLFKEIEGLKDKIPVAQWKVIDALRKLGNIGAHMEKDIDLIVDIDSGEAEKLIMLIERLIQDWYVDRHEQETLYDSILEISSDKESIKSGV